MARVSSADLADSSEFGDRFGAALAIANFNNDAAAGHMCNDLAIGVPGEDNHAGAIHVLYGSSPIGLIGTSIYLTACPGGDAFGMRLGGTPSRDLFVAVPWVGELRLSGAFGTVSSGVMWSAASFGLIGLAQDEMGSGGITQPRPIH